MLQGPQGSPEHLRHQHLSTPKVQAYLVLQVPLVLQEPQASQERPLMTSPTESLATFKVKVLALLDLLENQELSRPMTSSLSCREMM